MDIQMMIFLNGVGLGMAITNLIYIVFTKGDNKKCQK